MFGIIAGLSVRAVFVGLCASLLMVGMVATAEGREVPPEIKLVLDHGHTSGVIEPVKTDAGGGAGLPEPTRWIDVGSLSRKDRKLIEHVMLGVSGRFNSRLASQLIDAWDLGWLLMLERDLGLSDRLHGILVAWWVWETAACDDDRPCVIGDGGNAVGPFQLHKHLSRLCGGIEYRGDIYFSARCIAHHIKRVVEKLERYPSQRRKLRKCMDEVWVIAEARVANPSKDTGYPVKCGVRSNHGRLIWEWKQDV